MQRTITTSLSVCFTAWLGGAASAQPAEIQDESQTILPNLLSTQHGASVESRLDYTFLGGADLEVLGMTLHAQYLGKGVGGYVTLPLGHAEDEEGIGNLELGVLGLFGGERTTAYVRGAVSANTANDPGELVVPVAYLVARPADAVTSGLESNWLRGHLGLRHRRGEVDLGAQVGIDIPVDGIDEPMFVAVGAVGIVRPSFGIATSLTFLRAFAQSDRDPDVSIFTGNLVADVQVATKKRLFASFGINFEDLEAVSLGVGVRAGL